MCTLSINTSIGAPSQSSKGRKGPIRSQRLPSDEQQKTISDFLDDLRELGIGDPKSPPADGPSSKQPQSHSNTVPAEAEPHSTLSPVQQKLAQEWVPLELSFGVPLFNQLANRAVCDKVRDLLGVKVITVPSLSPSSPLRFWSTTCSVRTASINRLRLTDCWRWTYSTSSPPTQYVHPYDIT